MIGKTQAVRQPSMDELLASIRQAIHERVAPGAPAAQANSTSVSSSVKRTGATTAQEGFAGLLGGDVRLEEALARLNQTGPRRSAEAPGAVEKGEDAAVAAVAAPPAAPGLRPTIDEVSAPLVPPVAQALVRPAPAARAPIRPAINLASARQATAPARKDEFWEEDPIYDAPLLPERTARIAASATPGDLLSSEAANVANSAFKRLTDAMAGRPSSRERTLDEITRECLRPLLKVWLDENLPGLVERLVREEIERVARHGR